MSDNGEEEADEPVVELGDGDDVEGAPVARVASRLFFPIEKSEVLRREGETTVRTPDGPQSVREILDRSDEVYFETNTDLVNTVEAAVGTGPVPTVGGSGSDGAASSEPAPESGDMSESGDASESEAGADEAGDTEVAEGAETAESPGTEPEEDEVNREADADADADEGEFEFDDE